MLQRCICAAMRNLQQGARDSKFSFILCADPVSKTIEHESENCAAAYIHFIVLCSIHMSKLCFSACMSVSRSMCDMCKPSEISCKNISESMRFCSSGSRHLMQECHAVTPQQFQKAVSRSGAE